MSFQTAIDHSFLSSRCGYSINCQHAGFLARMSSPWPHGCSAMPQQISCRNPVTLVTLIGSSISPFREGNGVRYLLDLVSVPWWIIWNPAVSLSTVIWGSLISFKKLPPPPFRNQIHICQSSTSASLPTSTSVFYSPSKWSAVVLLVSFAIGSSAYSLSLEPSTVSRT